MSGDPGDVILVVEDDADVREALVEILADNDYAPVSAANGEEALTYLRSARAKPCVILLDVMMPVMDGPTFRAAQQADDDLAAIPVIVLSAHASVQGTAAAMRASHYLRKPLDLDDLVASIERFRTR